LKNKGSGHNVEISQSPQGKAWLRLCSEDMRFATLWPTNGLVLTTAMTSVNNEAVCNSQLRCAAVKAPSGEHV